MLHILRILHIEIIHVIADLRHLPSALPWTSLWRRLSPQMVQWLLALHPVPREPAAKLIRMVCNWRAVAVLLWRVTRSMRSITQATVILKTPTDCLEDSWHSDRLVELLEWRCLVLTYLWKSQVFIHIFCILCIFCILSVLFLLMWCSCISWCRSHRSPAHFEICSILCSDWGGARRNLGLRQWACSEGLRDGCVPGGCPPLEVCHASCGQGRVSDQGLPPGNSVSSSAVSSWLDPSGAHFRQVCTHYVVWHILHIWHIWHIFSWPGKGYKYFCPPPQPKAKTDDQREKGTEGAMTGVDYDLMLHCTIGHMRRVDGIYMDFDDGEKTMTLIGKGPGLPRCIFCICYIFLIFYIFDIFLVCLADTHFALHSLSTAFGTIIWFTMLLELNFRRFCPNLFPETTRKLTPCWTASFACKHTLLHIVYIWHIFHIQHIYILISILIYWFVAGWRRTVKTPRKYHWLAKASKLTSTTSSGSCPFPASFRLTRCWQRRRFQTNLGAPSATKSRPITWRSELRRTSGRDGKLGLQSMWLARRLGLRWLCHPQESSLWSATEPALCAGAFVPELGRRWLAVAELHWVFIEANTHQTNGQSRYILHIYAEYTTHMQNMSMNMQNMEQNMQNMKRNMHQ